MQGRSFILLASRSSEALDALARVLVPHVEFAFAQRQIINGDTDPLRGAGALPDVLVLHVTPNATDELAALAQRAPDERPPLVVVGAGHDPAAMRLAMQAGARDFLSEPVSERDLITALQRVASEVRAAHPASSSASRVRTCAFINAKGGSGATFLASNVAHTMAAVSGFDTLLVDLDLQFGTLPQYLDVQPRRGLLEALEAAEELDALSMDAYLTRHSSGLRILARSLDSRIADTDEVGERFGLLMNIIRSKCQRLVFDVPRHLDVVSAMALQSVDRIVVVMQQTLPNLRDGTHLVEALRRDLAIPQDRIGVLVNRYNKDAAVELTDIRRALRDVDPFLVPNHYKSVSESIDAGVPIYEHSRHSPVTKAILAVASDLGGDRTVRAVPGLLSRAFQNFLRA